MVAKTLTSVCGLVAVILGLICIRPVVVRLAVGLRFQRMSLTVLDGKPLGRNKLIKSLHEERTNRKTVLVYGNRGAGKTTAIELAFEGRRSVLRLELEDEENANDPAAALRQQLKGKLFFLPYLLPDTWIKIAFKIHAKWFCRAFVVVSISIDLPGKVMKNVLKFCKTHGYDTNHVKFFVDVSAANAALAGEDGHS